MKMLAILSLCAISLGCNAGPEGLDQYDAIRFSDPEVHRIFLRELNERGVQYRINEDGEVAPDSEQKREFSSIAQDMLSRYAPSMGFSIPDSSYTDDLVQRFHSEQIEFTYVQLRDRIIFSFQEAGSKYRAEKLYDEEYRGKVTQEQFEKLMRNRSP